MLHNFETRPYVYMNTICVVVHTLTTNKEDTLPFREAEGEAEGGISKDGVVVVTCTVTMTWTTFTKFLVPRPASHWLHPKPCCDCCYIALLKYS